MDIFKIFIVGIVCLDFLLLIYASFKIYWICQLNKYISSSKYEEDINNFGFEYVLVKIKRIGKSSINIKYNGKIIK